MQGEPKRPSYPTLSSPRSSNSLRMSGFGTLPEPDFGSPSQNPIRIGCL